MKRIINFIYHYYRVFIILLISASIIILSQRDNAYMKYKSENELINTFVENEDLFIETTRILKDNLVFNEIMKNTGENALRNVNDENLYNYFANDEVETLKCFFDIAKPYMVKKIPGGAIQILCKEEHI